MTFQKFVNYHGKRAIQRGMEKEAIKILVLELSGMDGATFFANIHQEIPFALEEKLTKAVDAYIEKKKPVQHIIGYSYFYGYKIKVNDQVLIPRPETEELVSYVLQTYDAIFPEKEVDVVDVGTGSGAIAIALSKEEKHFHVVATDISETALLVAKENAKNNNAEIQFFIGDMLEPLIERQMKFDILVSNPPYIPNKEYVEDIVKQNEPHVALFGGEDGMHFYEIILKHASKVVKEKCIIAFEHGYTKKNAMIDLAKTYFPDAIVESIQDLNGKDRFTIIVKK